MRHNEADIQRVVRSVTSIGEAHEHSRSPAARLSRLKDLLSLIENPLLVWDGDFNPTHSPTGKWDSGSLWYFANRRVLSLALAVGRALGAYATLHENTVTSGGATVSDIIYQRLPRKVMWQLVLQGNPSHQPLRSALGEAAGSMWLTVCIPPLGLATAGGNTAVRNSVATGAHRLWTQGANLDSAITGCAFTDGQLGEARRKFRRHALAASALVQDVLKNDELAKWVARTGQEISGSLRALLCEKALPADLDLGQATKRILEEVCVTAAVCLGARVAPCEFWYIPGRGFNEAGFERSTGGLLLWTRGDTQFHPLEVLVNETEHRRRLALGDWLASARRAEDLSEHLRQFSREMDEANRQAAQLLLDRLDNTRRKWALRGLEKFDTARLHGLRAEVLKVLDTSTNETDFLSRSSVLASSYEDAISRSFPHQWDQLNLAGGERDPSTVREALNFIMGALGPQGDGFCVMAVFRRWSSFEEPLGQATPPRWCFPISHLQAQVGSAFFCFGHSSPYTEMTEQCRAEVKGLRPRLKREIELVRHFLHADDYERLQTAIVLPLCESDEAGKWLRGWEACTEMCTEHSPRFAGSGEDFQTALKALEAVGSIRPESELPLAVCASWRKLLGPDGALELLTQHLSTNVPCTGCKVDIGSFLLDDQWPDEPESRGLAIKTWDLALTRPVEDCRDWRQRVVEWAAANKFRSARDSLQCYFREIVLEIGEECIDLLRNESIQHPRWLPKLNNNETTLVVHLAGRIPSPHTSKRASTGA